jgi:hypothetical protein
MHLFTVKALNLLDVTSATCKNFTTYCLILITLWILGCRNCHCSIFYTSKILCLELHMEFYKVAGDFFVTIVTVNLVPYSHILYICIYFRDWGVEEVVNLM